MFEEKPSLHAMEAVVRRQLALAFHADEIDPILAEAEADNTPAQFIVAGALEAGGEHEEAMKWYRRAAEQGYLPALERLRRDSFRAA
jgi:TPR repeat protein